MITYTGSQLAALDVCLDHIRREAVIPQSSDVVGVIGCVGEALAKRGTIPANRLEAYSQMADKLRQESSETLSLLATGHFTWGCQGPDLFSIIPDKPVHLPEEGGAE
jgi:hypothetical protein